MKINYNLIIICMLFVILVSIQYTLNKIYKTLNEIKVLMYKDKLRDGKYD
ncbi:hypothetical protein GCM10008904_13910 [Paraclostridium ghonii]|uniref:Uncharacterized protein n=1 Tax=Paraclostridium ghonii TaxID=29358 RepID=A0ABU0N304_9FIRM|nr:hypothetical protein [Paeniclostridium ghonii]MCM0165293.1 hypothetical protein [Paeniclostridium ghonii]MDQ0557516.1 hypothetical protein [Paeniclostridium ghonii]